MKSDRIPETRGAKSKYPWHKLKNLYDYFIWDNPSDRPSITASARHQGIKVRCRTIDGVLRVYRAE